MKTAIHPLLVALAARPGSESVQAAERAYVVAGMIAHHPPLASRKHGEAIGGMIDAALAVRISDHADNFRYDRIVEAIDRLQAASQ